MSHEIKYRIWDKRYGRFWNLGKGFTIKELATSYREIVLYDDFILQISTGLNDSNGKEIFEGDILKVNWYCDADYVKCVWDNGRGSWAFCTIDQEDDPVMAWHFFGKDSNFVTSIVVAGNIFNDVKLLKLPKKRKK